MHRVTLRGSRVRDSLAKVALIQYDDLEIATIFDGDNYNLRLDLFRPQRRETFVELLRRSNLPPEPMITSVNAFLIRDDGRTILVDSGMGHYSGSTMGYLVESLSLLDVEPGQVTDVILTHMHRDHAGGLIDREGAATFPEATVHVSRPELAYWSDPGLMACCRPEFRPFVQVAQTVLEVYGKRVRTVDEACAFSPRVAVSPIAGHTPGHTAVWLQGRSARMCMWGDLVHSAALQCPVPEITVAFDADEQQARATRADLFARASRERFLVCGAHLPFPGVGWIDAQEGGGYLFDPLRAS